MYRLKLRRSLWTAAAIGLFATPSYGQAPKKLQCIAASEEGQDLQKAGKLREAESRFATCSAPSCPSVVRDDCVARLAELRQRMASIRFDVTDGSGNNVVAGVKITLDGKPLADYVDGSSIAVDPGKHRFTFERPGVEPVTKEVSLSDGEKDRREAVMLGVPEPKAAPRRPSPEAAPSPPDYLPIYVAFGVAGVGLAVGIFGFVLGRGEDAGLEKRCTLPDGKCPADARDAVEALDRDNLIMGLGFGVAIVAAGVGTYFLLQEPPRKHKKPSIVSVAPRLGVGWVGVEGKLW